MLIAEDFLAKVTAGALSDVSSNVKKLDATNMNEVKGGLEFKGPWQFSYNDSNFVISSNVTRII